MIKKSVFEDELIAGMQRELQPFEKKAAVNDLVKAAEYLHSAVEIFEEAGMSAKADQVLRILAKIAHDEASEKIQKMIEEESAPDSGGEEPIDLESIKPLTVEERLRARQPAPEEAPEVFEFKSLMHEPEALPPREDGEELVFRSIAQELGLIDDNDAKPRKPKNPTNVSTRHNINPLEMADADDLLDLEISEDPIEVTETSAGKTFEDSD